MSRVAIIGAGVAGLSAARRLKEGGVEASLFEAGRRPGGRASTQKQHDRQFDHGAQYLTPHSRRSAVLFSDWRKAGWINRWPALAYELPERKKIDSSSWHVPSPSMATLTERLGQGLSCQTKCTVTSIEGQPGERYLVTSNEQRLGPFEVVLCALPAEAAQALMTPFAELANLAAQVTSRPCLATMVMFEEEVMVDFEAAYLSDGPLAWVVRDSSKPGRPKGECWVLHATERWSREQLSTPAEKVASLMLSAFAQLSPIELPDVSYCRSHRWRHALPEAPLALPFCFDDQLKVGLAGDWCSSGSVDATYWSGHDLAEAVLRSLSP